MTYILFSFAIVVVASPFIYRYLKARTAIIPVSMTLSKLFTDLQKDLPMANVSTAGVTIRVAFPQADMFACGGDQIKTDVIAPLETIAKVVNKYENVNFFVNCLAGKVDQEELDTDLAYKRAEQIRLLFIRNGISEDRILATSIGQLDEKPSDALPTAEVICYEIRN